MSDNSFGTDPRGQMIPVRRTVVDDIVSQIGRYHVLKSLILFSMTIVGLAFYILGIARETSDLVYRMGIVRECDNGICTVVVDGKYSFKISTNEKIAIGTEIGIFVRPTGDIVTVPQYRRARRSIFYSCIAMLFIIFALYQYWQMRDSEFLHSLGAFVQYFDLTT